MGLHFTDLIILINEDVRKVTMQLDSFPWHPDAYFEDHVSVPLPLHTRLVVSRDSIFAQPHPPYHLSANARRPYVHALQRQISR